MTAKSYWDSYYSNNNVDNFQTSSFLVQVLSRLPKGKVLDVGMGKGQNSVYLAQNGFKVKGFDASSKAVEIAKDLASSKTIEVDFQQVDLDLFLFGIMEYEVVLMSYFKPPIKRYYSELMRTLKQGGMLVVDSYLVDEQSEAISMDEAYKNYYYYSNELLHNLKGMKILFYQEGLVDGKCRVQCLAQKPLDKDAVRYKLFDMSTGTPDSTQSKQRELAEALFKKKD